MYDCNQKITKYCYTHTLSIIIHVHTVYTCTVQCIHVQAYIYIHTLSDHRHSCTLTTPHHHQHIGFRIATHFGRSIFSFFSYEGAWKISVEIFTHACARSLWRNCIVQKIGEDKRMTKHFYRQKRADQACACKMPRADVASLTKY